MENEKLSKYTVSFALAFALASVVNGILVVIKEKSPTVQAEMQKLTGHHWITHSVIVLGLFFFCGWLFAQTNHGQGFKPTTNGLVAVLVSGVVLGAAIIAGFYLLGD